MNSCILMAEIIQNPQLRYTSDQVPVAEMFVQFRSQRSEDRPATLKVVAWRNLAQEMHERYHEGDKVVIEGRLGMISVTLQDGVKEKRAELTASRIHNITGAEGSFTPHVAVPAPATISPPASTAPNNVVPLSSRPAATSAPSWQYNPEASPAQPYSSETPAPKSRDSYINEANPSLDDEIPF